MAFSDLKLTLGKLIVFTLFLMISLGCSPAGKEGDKKTSGSEFIEISRTAFANQLYGFWLGQSIANWTGLVTEMDKIGNIGEIKTGRFYTREDWGKPDQPSIWGEGAPSDLSPTIDFVLRGPDEVWGSDDDTDIEYMYQYLMYSQETSILTPQQIRDGWLTHIKAEEENYLWVSNQRAFDLMQEGMLPPATGAPVNNEHYAMIDAQLTTEIFGILSPARPDIARNIAELPIQTTARYEAQYISEFYVTMHALAAKRKASEPLKEFVHHIADEARLILPDSTYPAKMYDFVKSLYYAGVPWETTRDSIYQRYQVKQADGYDITSQNLYCNGCFAAGINFAASLVSLFYGEGDFIDTVKIGTLAGWDSDNPTATWGGLLGFLLGKEALESTLDQPLSNRFNIHRTRQNFPGNGIETFDYIAEMGISVIDRVIVEQMHGSIDSTKNIWLIPLPN